MIWHDKRLIGDTPRIAPNTYHVDGDVEIDHAISWIAFYAGSQGGLDELIVMCHGYEADWDLTQQVCTGTEVGGFGLQICKQGISISNVAKLAAWKGSGGALIKQVTIYSCGAAGVGEGNEGTSADGPRFMGKIATYSGAYVVAARDTQMYTYSPINFGQWEGPVFLFDPVNGLPQSYAAGPMT
jgi:hypothetical protein